MSTFEIVLLVFAIVLAAAALAVVYRMIVGPTILDRALASDSLVTLVVMGMALYAAQSEAIWAGPAMLALTGLAFIGTVTFARFVAREDPRQGRRSRHADEPVTETAAHEAIHPDPLAAPLPEEGPDNRFDPAPEAEPWGEEDPLENPHRPGEPEPGDIAESGGDADPAGVADSDGVADPARVADSDGVADSAGMADSDDLAESGGVAESGGFGDEGPRWPEEPTEGGR